MDDRGGRAAAKESYREMIAYGGERDPTTRRLLDDIPNVVEEHAVDLTSPLFVDGDESARNVDGPGGPNDRP